MAYRGTAVYAFRLQQMLRTYLNTYVDSLDTTANAAEHVVADFDLFTTETIADDDIQVWDDSRQGELIRLVLRPTGTRNLRAGGMSKEGVASGAVRIDQEHAFQLYVVVQSAAAEWGERGAWLRADRVMHAAQAVLQRYPQLDVPGASPALTAFSGCWLELGGTARLPDQDEEDTLAVTLVCDFLVRAMERWS